MKYIFIAIIFGLIAMLSMNRLDSEYQRGFSDALKSAYKTNPPGEQLELVCAGLWLGDQSKKYYEKDNRRAR